MISSPGFSPAAAARPAAVPPMVSTQWLCDHLGSDTMVVLDARGFAAPDDLSEPRCSRIPTAQFADAFRVSAAGLATEFAAAAERFGIGADTMVVIYDTGAAPAPGTATSASALRDVFAAAGHDRVSVLVGGFAKWCAEERPLESAADSAAA